MRVSLLLFLLLSGFAHAEQTCSASSTDTRQRLLFIQTHLHEDARHARIWTGAWGAGYGTLALAQLVLTSAAPKEMQPDLYVGAISSAGALAAMLAVPLRVMEDSSSLDALAHPETVDCEQLAQAEQLLVRSAQNEAEGHSWVLHGANVLYNVVFGLILGLAFDRWSAGLINTLVGILIGEAMILTQPTGAEDTLRRYRAGELSTLEQPRPAWGPQLTVASSRVGVQLGFSF